MKDLTEWRAVERRYRDALRSIVEKMFADCIPGREAEMRGILQPLVETLDAADAEDDAIAADLLAQVDLDGRSG